MFLSVLMPLAIMALQVPGPTHLGVRMRCLGPSPQKGPTVAGVCANFATRMASRSWTSDSESLNHHFQLPSLSSCRTYFKVLSTCKCLNSYTFCPPGNFSLHANPNLRVCHCKQLVVSFAKLLLFTIPFY